MPMVAPVRSDHKKALASNRWIGDFPKIGIWPAIDGRRKGVRESLEEQTMNMARSVAGLLSRNLFYPNGEPVQCVIADTCIGGVAEAAQAAVRFAREGVGVSLRVRISAPARILDHFTQNTIKGASR